MALFRDADILYTELAAKLCPSIKVAGLLAIGMRSRCMLWWIAMGVRLKDHSDILVHRNGHSTPCLSSLPFLKTLFAFVFRGSVSYNNHFQKQGSVSIYDLLEAAGPKLHDQLRLVILCW